MGRGDAINQCKVYGCTDRIKCVEMETGKECEWIDCNLCSFCYQIENTTRKTFISIRNIIKLKKQKMSEDQVIY